VLQDHRPAAVDVEPRALHQPLPDGRVHHPDAAQIR
jgi:hypothetical protein